MSWVRDSADLVGDFAAVLSIAVVLILARFPRTVSKVAGQPIRSAARTFSGAQRRTARTQAKVLTDQLRVSGTNSMPPAHVVWATLRATADLPAESQSLAYRDPAFETLHELVQRALDPTRRGLLVTLLAADAWGAHQTQLELVDAYLRQFADLLPASSADLMSLRELQSRPGSQPIGFAAFVSGVTGATVIVDTAQVQGGCGKAVVVMHCPEWEGPRPHASTDSSVIPPGVRGTPYEAMHRDRSQRVLSNRVVGQYDGRIPTLVSAELAERPGLGGAIIVLTTRETCYAATEPPGIGSLGAPCKGLGPSLDDSLMSRFHRHEKTLTVTRSPGGVQTRRPVQLNVVLGLLTHSKEGVGLVLARRTDKVRNAAGGIGPASGGVIELPVSGARRDGDSFGAVDPRAGAVRELVEELGLRVEPEAVSPVAVYLSNVRNRPVKPDRLRTGQLVATVMFLTNYQGSFADVVEARCHADPTEGAFESSGILSVDMGSSAEQFVRHLFAPDSGAPISSATGRRPDVYSQLEQSALLTCLYACASVHGAGPTARAFADALPGPWWSDAWSSPEDMPKAGTRAKVCREPGDWLGEEGKSALMASLEFIWPGRAQSWLGALRDRIQADDEALGDDA